MMRTITKSILTFMVFMVANVSFATNYYVSTTGSNSNAGTTSATSFATLTYAISKAAAGDVIFLASGTYTTTATIVCSKSNITIKGVFTGQANRPVLDFSSMSLASSNYGIQLKGSNNYIYGIKIKGAGDNGLLIDGGNYNKIEFCDFLENRDTGLQLKAGAHNNKMINCDSYYNVDAAQGNADGFANKLDVGGFNLFDGCRAYQNSDDGWDGLLGDANNTPADTIVNSWCYKNGYLKDGSASQGNGNGFKLGGTQGSATTGPFIHRQTLKNCLSAMNRVKGYDYNNNVGSMILYNCSAYGNGGIGNFAFPNTVKSGESLILKNCLSFDTKYGSINASAVQATNSWSGGFTVNKDDFESIDHTQMLLPRKDDGSLPDITFMHLATGSDLIDAGTNVGLTYNGSKPDLGCFETSSSTTPTCTAKITASGATTFCKGGSVNLTSSTGSSYVWKNGTTQVATTASYTATTSGSYTVEVTNAAGCKAVSSATVVTVNALPTATITTSGATTFCNGGSVNLTSSTGASYVWRNGATTVGATASYTAKTAGNYSVIVTNASGCKDTSAATTVTVNALPTATITASGATTFCNGGSVNLTSSTGSSYVWRNGTTTVGTTASYTAKTAGNYSVIVTNASGCKDTSTATTVTVNALPTATITPSGALTFCNGGSVNLTSSTGASYVWRNGTTTVGTTASYTAKTAGNYTVIVTNASGCKDTSVATVVTVNATATPSIITGDDIVCANSTSRTYSITNIPDATTYTWTLPTGASITSGANTNAIVVSFASTSGNVSVSATNGCGVGSVVKKAISITTDCILFDVVSTKNSIDLNWTIAGIQVKSIQLMRNISSSTVGRGRIAIPAANAKSYSDTSALDNTDYWYWLKITDVNDVVYNSTSVQGKIAVVTGLDDVENDIIKVYPNPFSEEFTMKINNSFSYIIEDLQGKTITSGNTEGETLIGNNLDRGIYIIKIISENQSRTLKIVKE